MPHFEDLYYSEGKSFSMKIKFIIIKDTEFSEGGVEPPEWRNI